MILIKSTKIILYRIISRHISRATLVEGVIKNHNKLFKCLFIGNSEFVNYFTERTFSETPRVLKRCRIWIRKLEEIVLKNSDKFDICIAVIPKEWDDKFKKIYNYKCDVCVKQSIDISGSIEEIKKAFHRQKRQFSNTINSKSNMAYRISNDMKDFEYFYNRMFLPHMKKRHGDMSIESYEDMKPYFLEGFLFFVLYEGEVVSGALCVVRDKTVYFRRAGVLDGDEKYIKLGAQNALYLFLIMHAKKLGLNYLDTMTSLSILNDGIYRTKREWGATVYADDESKHWIYFIYQNITDSVAKFFEINPIIVNTNDGLCGLVGYNGENPIINGCDAELKKKYYSPGINKILILTPESEKAMTTPLSGQD